MDIIFTNTKCVHYFSPVNVKTTSWENLSRRAYNNAMSKNIVLYIEVIIEASSRADDNIINDTMAIDRGFV